MPIANLLTYKNRDPVLDRKASQADPLLTNFLGLKWVKVIFGGASPTFSQHPYPIDHCMNFLYKILSIYFFRQDTNFSKKKNLEYQRIKERIEKILSLPEILEMSSLFYFFRKLCYFCLITLNLGFITILKWVFFQNV